MSKASKGGKAPQKKHVSKADGIKKGGRYYRVNGETIPEAEYLALKNKQTKGESK